jgi:hypothetical protein
MPQETLFPDGHYGKMFPVPSHLIKEPTSGRSSTKWQTSGHWLSSGIASMHSSSESPNDEGEYSSSLASILVSPSEVDSKFYLSPKAAEGILRRADRRGKTLPEPLRIALQELADKMPKDGTATEQE